MTLAYETRKTLKNIFFNLLHGWLGHMWRLRTLFLIPIPHPHQRNVGRAFFHFGNKCKTSTWGSWCVLWQTTPAGVMPATSTDWTTFGVMVGVGFVCGAVSVGSCYAWQSYQARHQILKQQKDTLEHVEAMLARRTKWHGTHMKWQNEWRDEKRLRYWQREYCFEIEDQHRDKLWNDFTYANKLCQREKARFRHEENKVEDLRGRAKRMDETIQGKRRTNAAIEAEIRRGPTPQEVDAWIEADDKAQMELFWRLIRSIREIVGL